MTNDIDKKVVSAVRSLYKENSHAQALFDLLAVRRRDATATSIDRFSSVLNITRGDAVELARALNDTECGRFVVGRRGGKSRFEWDYSVISLGQAAAGESADLERAVDPVSEVDDDLTTGEGDVPAVAVGPVTPRTSGTTIKSISISEAKQMLAASLGVNVENIEIIVKV